MKIGYVYSGAGGAIGFLAGALSALKPHYEADKIIGVSSGALVGIMHATDNTSKMDEVLATITDDKVIKKRTFRYIYRFTKHLIGVQDPMIGFYDNKPLRKLLSDILFGSFVKIDYTSLAVDYETGELIEFYFPKGLVFAGSRFDNMISMIIASTAIPVVFPPEKLNGKLYVDAGVATHAPIKQMMNADIDFMNIISSAGDGKINGSPKSDIEIASNTVGKLISNVSEKDFMEFELKNELAKHDDRYKFYESNIIKPTVALSPPIRFHHKFIKKDYAHGFNMANNAMRK